MLKATMLNDVHRFLEESNYTEQSKRTYGYCLKRLADWLEHCGLDIASMDAGLFKRFVADNPAWGNNMQRLMGNAMKSFIRWRFGEKHPALTVKLPRDDSGPQRTPSAAEINRLLSSFNTNTAIGWRNLCMIEIMLETGIREAEVCALQLSKLSLSSQTLLVRAKGGDWREGVFSSYTAACLENWLAARGSIARRGVKTVFVSIGGNTPGMPLTPGGLRSIFRGFARRAQIEALSPHDMRRAMACLYTEAGAPTRTVQLLGGWKDIQMVVRYTRTLRPRVTDVERYSPVKKTLKT